jgi:hypothetical protein
MKKAAGGGPPRETLAHFLLGRDWLLFCEKEHIIGRRFRIGHGRFVSSRRRFLFGPIRPVRFG